VPPHDNTILPNSLDGSQGTSDFRHVVATAEGIWIATLSILTGLTGRPLWSGRKRNVNPTGVQNVSVRAEYR
jgi:hypothetical protein